MSFSRSMEKARRRTIPVFLPHRGCSDRCIYCSQDDIAGSVAMDGPEIFATADRQGEEPVEVGLYGGDILGLSPDDLERLFQSFAPWDRMIANFRISTRPKPLTNETIGILKRFRVTVIELGVPCFDDGMLAALNRRHTVSDLAECHSDLTNEGFTVAFQVMVGLPGETRTSLSLTGDWIERLRPSFLRIYSLVVLRKTPLADLYEKGLFHPISLDEAIDRTAYISLEALGSGIETVSLGLTENERLIKNLIAGPYHPAFGYLVKSRIFRYALEKRLGEQDEREVVVEINSRDIPHLVGYRRENICLFERDGFRVAWKTGAMEEGTFTIHGNRSSVKGSILDALLCLRARYSPPESDRY